MTNTKLALKLWQRLSRLPMGKWFFSWVVCWKAPYFGSIRPRFVELQPGRCEVRMAKRRRVLNHIGTVHAIAMCNLAELAAGTMTDITVASSQRWIPRGMTVEYLAKAQTDLKAVAEMGAQPPIKESTAVPVTVNVQDDGGDTVLRAVIDMWVTPKPRIPVATPEAVDAG